MSKTEKKVSQEVDDLEIESSLGEDKKNKKNKDSDKGITISNSKLALVRSLLLNIKESNEKKQI